MISTTQIPVFDSTDWLCIQTLRTLSLDAIEKAVSGHPGLPLGAAPMAYVLWQYFLNHDPQDPTWTDRDRFVLSAGHGSMLLYSLLHLTGYLSLEDLKQFRQLGSRTPGHPEWGVTPGVEATTGPLGQGVANATGMAIAERFLFARFPELVDHFTYVLASDGDLMEGVSSESASLAGHLKLSKLIVLYDANQVTLDGSTSLSFSTEDVMKRYEAYQWHVQKVTDGDHDLKGIFQALHQAKEETTRPSLILVQTTIGYGSPHKEGTAAAHGAPLGEKEVVLTKERLNWSWKKPFFIPDEVKKRFQQGVERGTCLQKQWNTRFQAFQSKEIKKYQLWNLAWKKKLPVGWEQNLEKVKDVFSSTSVSSFSHVSGSRVSLSTAATREILSQCIQKSAPEIFYLLGGDADLSSSTKTHIPLEQSFEGRSGQGRNLHYGVREHAMAAAANGMLYHGGVRPFIATFFCFSDYMKPSVRISALSALPVIYIWTHDSIGVGEDGPTHQPIEHLAQLRALPNFILIRPGTVEETIEAWKFALKQKQSPVGLVLTRQKIPLFIPSEGKTFLEKGAYIFSKSKKQIPDLILIATGSELALAVEVQKRLEDKGHFAQVVSMPSWELFEMQPKAYQEKVLPSFLKKRVAIEAASPFGWEKWVGDQGWIAGIARFGFSVSGKKIFETFHLDADTLTQEIESRFFL